MTNLYGVRKYKDEWTLCTHTLDCCCFLVCIGKTANVSLYCGMMKLIGQYLEQQCLKMFKGIQGCIRFDDGEQCMTNTSSTNTPVRDKLASIRNVYDKWNHNSKALP